MHHHVIPRDAIGHARMGMDAAMRAELAAGANRAVVFQNGMRADFSARTDENKGTDFAAGPDHCIWGDYRAWMNAGLWLYGRMKQPCDLDEIGLR